MGPARAEPPAPLPPQVHLEAQEENEPGAGAEGGEEEDGTPENDNAYRKITHIGRFVLKRSLTYVV